MNSGRFRLSRHAKRRGVEREISFEEMIEVINDPHVTVSGKWLGTMQYTREISGRVIVVVVDEDKNPPEIVTAYCRD